MYRDLERRLAAEREALLRLLGRAQFQTPQALLAPTKLRSEVMSAKKRRNSNPQRANPAIAPNNHVAEGKGRLEAVGGIRESTRRAYQSALRGVDAWLREHRPGKALDDAALADYLAVLTTRGRSVSSAAQAVAAVR